MVKCKGEAVKLMHIYLDGDITKEEETALRSHLEECKACQEHFHELKRTVTLLSSTESIQVPEGFSRKVMDRLPEEKRGVRYSRWFKGHPFVTAAAIFFLFMAASLFSSWNQDTELVVSKEEDLAIQGSTVIVPEGVTVQGDLLVKNGNLIIEGTVDGDVTLINGKVINEPIEGEGLMASAGEVNGELETIDQTFEWLWYRVKAFLAGLFTF
ncbi:zf-HC2 domain-containing protein [Virgibacillus sediminis]|uniref:Anti-sigma-W factor RsiW n=1 Tax=Virgibacillus sediminis TaxID=202260 RepID=A0ABV7A370_9BACI